MLNLQYANDNPIDRNRDPNFGLKYKQKRFITNALKIVYNAIVQIIFIRRPNLDNQMPAVIHINI